MTTTLPRPAAHRSPEPPRAGRPRLLLAAVLAGAAIAVPVALSGGHLPTTAAVAPVLAAPDDAGPTTVRVDPLAAGRALAARPATGDGVLDTAVGDVTGAVDLSGGGQVEGAPPPRVVDGSALRFTMPGGARRSEVLPRLPEYREGDDVWVHDVSRLQDLPTDTTTWQVVLQWHQRANSGSPPIALEAGLGRLRLANVGADHQDLGALRPDDTIDVVLHVHFSRSPDDAEIDVWRDGRPQVLGYHPPRGTLLDGGDYLKLGLYRDPSITQDSVMTTTRLVVGPTAESTNVQGITPRR